MDLLPLLAQVLIFGIAFTGGQQTTPDGCFQSWTNSMVTCLAPYDTRTGVSDQQCRDVCLQNPSTCKAVQYNSNTRTCQLYQKSVDSQTRHFGSGFGCGGGRSSHSREGGRGSGRQPFPGRPGPGPFPGGPGPIRPGPGPIGPPPPIRGKRHHRGGRSSSHAGGRGCGGGGSGGGGCTPGLQTGTGYTYYRNTGVCTGGPTIAPTPFFTTTIALPAGATCPAGQLIRYYIVEGSQLSGSPDATFSANSEQACIDACTNNRLPDGRQVPCRSFDFDSSASRCSISFAPTGVPQGTPNDQIKHYEKTCVDSTFGNRCPGPYYRGPQKILIGYAQAVAGVSSAGECLQLCADSQARYGFVCQSVMYYSQEATSNCILNSETRLNHPDLYQTEPNDRVDYYEVGCNAIRAARATRLQGKRNRNVLVPNSNDYSGWTMCDGKVFDHRRYRRCRGMNPNKCDVDKAQCDPAKEDEYDLPEIITTTTSFTIGPTDERCAPMIRPNGSRDCDNGTRRGRDGRIEKCKPRC